MMKPWNVQCHGFIQTYGIDYYEIFSPIPLLNSIKILFSLSTNQNWKTFHMDTKNAFLYGKLIKKI